MKTILKGTVGSTAYGLNHADSDVDKLGCFVYPTEKILSLSPGDDTIVRHEPDVTLHEVSKAIHLAMKNNPTVLEMFWLPEYDSITAEGYLLIDIRKAFLSQNIRKTYGGYAKAQSERLQRRGDFGSDLKKRQEKHGRHCARLLIQGTQALATGDVAVRLTEDQVDLCRALGKLAVDDIDKFVQQIAVLDESMMRLNSDLPEKPDYDTINDALLTIRRMNYGMV